MKYIRTYEEVKKPIKDKPVKDKPLPPNRTKMVKMIHTFMKKYKTDVKEIYLQNNKKEKVWKISEKYTIGYIVYPGDNITSKGYIKYILNADYKNILSWIERSPEQWQEFETTIDQKQLKEILDNYEVYRDSKELGLL